MYVEVSTVEVARVVDRGLDDEEIGFEQGIGRRHDVGRTELDPAHVRVGRIAVVVGVTRPAVAARQRQHREDEEHRKRSRSAMPIRTRALRRMKTRPACGCVGRGDGGQRQRS